MQRRLLNYNASFKENFTEIAQLIKEFISIPNKTNCSDIGMWNHSYKQPYHAATSCHITQTRALVKGQLPVPPSHITLIAFLHFRDCSNMSICNYFLFLSKYTTVVLIWK
jgi:hypothetical protein